MTHVLNSFLDGLPLDMLFPTPKDLPSLARDKPLFSPVIQLLAQPWHWKTTWNITLSVMQNMQDIQKKCVKGTFVYLPFLWGTDYCKSCIWPTSLPGRPLIGGYVTLSFCNISSVFDRHGQWESCFCPLLYHNHKKVGSFPNHIICAQIRTHLWWWWWINGDGDGDDDDDGDGDSDGDGCSHYRYLSLFDVSMSTIFTTRWTSTNGLFKVDPITPWQRCSRCVPVPRDVIGFNGIY